MTFCWMIWIWCFQKMGVWKEEMNRMLFMWLLGKLEDWEKTNHPWWSVPGPMTSLLCPRISRWEGRSQRGSGSPGSGPADHLTVGRDEDGEHGDVLLCQYEGQKSQLTGLSLKESGTRLWQGRADSWWDSWESGDSRWWWQGVSNKQRGGEESRVRGPGRVSVWIYPGDWGHHQSGLWSHSGLFVNLLWSVWILSC